MNNKSKLRFEPPKEIERFNNDTGDGETESREAMERRYLREERKAQKQGAARWPRGFGGDV
jgi:hypothetical protein